MDVEDDIERRKRKKKKQISNQNKLARARTHVRGMENEYLFMSIFPYEVVLKRIDARNNDHFGAADLIIHKEIVKKLPEKGGCQQIPLADYNHCWRKKIAESFANHPNLTCKVPAFRFTDFKTSHLKGL